MEQWNVTELTIAEISPWFVNLGLLFLWNSWISFQNIGIFSACLLWINYFDYFRSFEKENGMGSGGTDWDQEGGHRYDQSTLIDVTSKRRKTRRRTISEISGSDSDLLLPLLRVLLTRKKVNWKNSRLYLRNMRVLLHAEFWHLVSRIPNFQTSLMKMCGYIGNTVFELFSKTGS